MITQSGRVSLDKFMSLDKMISRLAEISMDKTRLDKWLWAARFYKTRTLATEAITGGHVHVNGQRVKPARQIQIGDVLTIRKPPEEFIISVVQLSERRGPASAAQQLYTEAETSRQQRELLREQRRQLALHNPRPDKRPDKRQRRRIIRFRNIHDAVE